MATEFEARGYPLAVDSHVLGVGNAPTPFSAAEIREGCPAGRSMRLRIEPEQGEAYERSIAFIETDDDGAVQEVRRFDPAGRQVGEPETHRSTWLELQEHASFPTDVASIRATALDLPFGRFECMLYVVQGDAGEDHFWFARDLPGMPVRTESRRAGGVTSSTQMIFNEVRRD